MPRIPRSFCALRNALQVNTWLAMEAQFAELQDEAAAARADAEARESQLASVTAARDEQLAQVGWWGWDGADDTAGITQRAASVCPLSKQGVVIAAVC